MAKHRQKPKKSEKPPPRCKAIILAEKVIREADTGNISIISIFDAFVFPTFPGTTRQIYAFLQLIEGIGLYDIKVEIHDLKQNVVIARATGIRANFPEKLFRLNLMIQIPPLKIEHPGKYDVVIFANEQEIDRQQFATGKLPAPHEQQEGEDR